jgi:hypothetical protein
MVTLLASLSGFFGSLFPELIKYFLDKNDKKHELGILRIQLQNNKVAHKSKTEATRLDFEGSELKTLYATYKSGINWVDALNATVRPMLAYAFFGIYFFCKYLQYNLLIDNLSKSELFELLWSLEDQAIFASIISFYYGQRAFSKLIGKK